MPSHRKIRLNGHRRLTAPPPANNVVTADWDTLTPYSAVNRGFLNATATPLPQPFVTMLHAAQRADIPAGKYPALFSGSTQIQTQVDLVAPAFADGSFAYGALSAILPDTIAGNATNTYQIKAVSGSAPNTPKFSMATWAAANDLRLTFKTNLANLADDTSNYELKVSDVIAAGIVEGVGTGSGYPLSSYRVDRSGPVCMGWRFRGYMRRKSDGAYHRQLVGEIYVTAVTLTDMLIECKLNMPAAVDTQTRNSLQTVGPVNGDDFAPMTGIAVLTNNGATVHTWGGPNDFRAVTFPAATTDVHTGTVVNTIDTVANQIVFPNAAMQRPRNGVGYAFSSTGTLPAGLVAGRVYWPSVDFFQQRAYLLTRRAFLSGNAFASKVAWTANATATNPNYIFNYTYVPPLGTVRVQQAWFLTIGGTNGATPPVDDGTLDVVNGTAHYTPMNAVMTSQGTGTLSAYPVVHVFPCTYTCLVDEGTTDPIWTGSGAAPRVEAILDLAYHLDYARALPTYDKTISPLYPNAFSGWDGHSACEPSVQQQIDNFGDNPGTNLVGYLNNTNANALLQQNSIVTQRYARSEALRWADHWTTAEDPRSFMPLVGNNGPGNVSGTYSGLGPSMPLFYYAWPGRGVGKFTGIGNQTINSNLYDAKYQKLVNGSHLPAMWIQPYHKTARTIFLDMGVDLANTCMLSNADDTLGKNITINGRTYCSSIAVLDQVRGMGWASRALDCISDVLPTNHGMRAYITDCVQDTIDCALAVIADNQVNFPSEYNLGTMRWARNTASFSGVQHFFTGCYILCIAQAARKNRYPGWRAICEHVGGRYFMPIFDDAGPGNAGLADYNNTLGSGCYVVNTATPGTIVTLTPKAYTNNPSSVPAPITYTVPSGATTTTVAQDLVSLINSTSAYTSFGFQANYEDTKYFNVRVPSALFDRTNDHADGVILFDTAVTKWNAVWQHCQSTGSGGKYRSGQVFASPAEMIEYNLGPGWPKSRTTDMSFAGTGTGGSGSLHLPYGTPAVPNPGWFPWGPVQYVFFVRMALATLAEAGIQGIYSTAAQVTQMLEDRLQTTLAGPPKFSGNSNGQPGTGPRTFPNFDIRRPIHQVQYPNS